MEAAEHELEGAIPLRYPLPCADQVRKGLLFPVVVPLLEGALRRTSKYLPVFWFLQLWGPRLAVIRGRLVQVDVEEFGTMFLRGRAT